MRLTIVGSGRAAWTFASIWSAAGRSATLVSRNQPSSVFEKELGTGWQRLSPASVEEAELVLFAVTDDAIRTVYDELENVIPSSSTVFHASGALSSEVFAHEKRFSLHPLRSLSPVEHAETDFRGTLFTWEGTSSTRALAEEIAAHAEGEFRAIATDKKILYHAAAVFGANYVAALLEEAVSLMTAAGVRDCKPALRNLAISASRNWSDNEGTARFTGPVARGDADILRRHLEELEDRPREAMLYRMLATILLDAVEPNADPSSPSRIRSIVEYEEQS